MRILLLGATGRTGRFVMDFCRLLGYQVTALVRDASRLERIPPDLRVVKGSPEILSDVQEAIKNCDAVIVTLNNISTPGSISIQAPFLIANSVRNCLAVMAERGPRRIVVMSMLGVGDSLGYAPAAIHGMKGSNEFKTLFADHEATDMLIKESPLDWTEVRAVGLRENGPLKDLIVTYAGTPRPAPTISRRHVAKFLVECLDDKNYFKKSPIISER